MKLRANVGDGNAWSILYNLHMPLNFFRIFCGFIFRSALSEYEVDIQNGRTSNWLWLVIKTMH